MAIKCPNCGANVSRHDSVCSCCGNSNTECRSIDRETVFILGGGQETFQAADYEAAILSFTDALDLDPEVFDAYFYLAEAYSALNRHEDAIQALEKAQSFRPGSAAPSYNLGMLCQRMGRETEAQNYFKKALALAQKERTIPDQKQYTIRIFLRQGMDAFSHENYEVAIRYFRLVTSLTPEIFDAHFYLAGSYSALNRHEDAIQAMEQAQQLEPGNAPLAYNLGILYKRVGRKSEAQKQFEQAIALADRAETSTDKKQFKIRILFEQGQDALQAENYEATIQYFTHVIDLDPDVFDAHFYLGVAYSALKRPAEAIQAMEKAQRLRPGGAPLAYNLGTLYQQIGRKAEAQKQFEQALSLVETDATVANKKQLKELIEQALKESKRWI